ncbi:MAG: glutaconate CoA-transferase [Deltaproteobacteria bacterium]|jgi:glutaconate CoA-transferase, subunit B|nr:glutaconate CoA-transferase [Deltaproteobacteria bacterium]MBT4644238.1 glutaconate CoA-transferase [Deltaproteobacteria bacterium]MBT6500506.1 glutaconate CoA-transferase [Deltaproteobacteria bacterium]MBT7715903.1 glutaconate CoA-transferase [Deltaproteobacteria bacterium]MBT7889223.1 glutaconate CoA-transferase [Deltaproteobacteria bacterium]
MNKKYTLNELLIIAAAREIHDDENVILGVGLPTTAGALAKALHAPHANLMMESGIIDFEPLVQPNHIADAMSCRGFSCSTDLFTAFTMTYRGFVDVCFLGVGQIDKFGNLNTTCLGDYNSPDLRLPGSGGAADFISYAKRTILTLRGGDFVEKLDYFTSPGYLEGGDAREKSGLYCPGSGPSMLITQKGIFKFDEVTKEMYLAQKHPLISLEDIQAEIPWELKVADDLTETDPPSQEEIEFIRRFAPAEALGRSLMRELAINNLFKEMSK